MNSFCIGFIVGVLTIMFLSLACSGLLLRSVKPEPGNGVVIDGNVSDDGMGEG